jgi:2-polyprenyl-6-methoxyphenol hydroxylase-like FAD-dependent oxidoreductase
VHGALTPRESVRLHNPWMRSGSGAMKILISGAGIAGPTLAHWLLRGGHEPTLLERAPAFRTGGYVIDFWGTGYRVAQRMGLEDAVLDAGYQVHALRAVNDAGRLRAELDTDVFQRVAGGKFTSLPRGDLAALAYATIEGRAEAVFGDSIASIQEHASGVRVGFEHGAERDFDLVVGADGLHSNVRTLAFGPECDYERFLGCRVAACVVQGYRPRDELVYVTHNVPDRQVGRFALRGDRTMFLFVFRSQGTVEDDIAAQKAVLRREFSDAGWECPAMLEAMDSVDELYFDVVSQILMPGWSRGRIALVGDAAACASLLAGEGTGLAMTGACVLAGELHRAGGDWRRAFAAYEARLRPFVRGKQDAARKYLGFFATRTRFGLWLRELGMRAMNQRFLADLAVGRGLRDDFDLPDYGI